MTFKDLSELKSLSLKELMAAKNEAQKYYSSISFEKESGQLKDTSHLKKTRQYIARISTFITEINNNTNTQAA